MASGKIATLHNESISVTYDSNTYGFIAATRQGNVVTIYGTIKAGKITQGFHDFSFTMSEGYKSTSGGAVLNFYIGSSNDGSKNFYGKKAEQTATFTIYGSASNAADIQFSCIYITTN